jgi:hypothetical protein
MPLSARSRLALLYTALFAVGGATLVTVTYFLVAHSLPTASTAASQTPARQAIVKCLKAARSGGVTAPDAKRTCVALYANGVHAGASAERSTTLAHLLTYSLIGLACMTVAASVAGWPPGRVAGTCRHV